ncbi:unnamed protein product [Durusdinium trenchii]|uniref:Ankyrin repeat domain-containing protein n=1 Tax=Durusdinium trenchii TaxID=1381693 RepID=A0ABP0MNK3_9DINO
MHIFPWRWRWILMWLAGAVCEGSLLHVPARAGNASEVADLLDRGDLGPWVNYRAKDGQTPVMAASLAGHAEVVELLIQRGCNVTIGDQDGYTPLDAAASMGHFEVAEVLMKYGRAKELHTFHDDGFAPIHRACWGDGHEHFKVVHVLLEAKIDPELRARNGTSCFQLAKEKETLDLLRKYIAPRNALTASGADPAKTEL